MASARALLLAAVTALAAPAPALAASPAPAASACPDIEVKLDDAIVASRAKPGDGFRYTTVSSADPRIPAGLRGNGRIAGVNHARKNSMPADITLRFDPVDTGHGTYALRGNAEDGSAYVAAGANRTRTGYTLIPDIGIMLTLRNIFQTGKDLELPAGTPFCLRVG